MRSGDVVVELVSVERSITEAMLEAGEIQIGPDEQQRLGLPDHSEDLLLDADGDTVPVRWVAARRRLTGTALAEYLQDTGRIDGLLRLARRDLGRIELIVLQARPSSFGSAFTHRPAVTTPAPTRSPISAVPRQRRAKTGARYRLRHRDEYVWQGQVGFLRAAREELLAALQKSGWDPAEAVRLRLEGERLVTLDQFEELLAIGVAKIEHMPHQEAAARTVLARMNGRGILADEVGLGKTVETGLVIKELVLIKELVAPHVP